MLPVASQVIKIAAKRLLAGLACVKASEVHTLTLNDGRAEQGTLVRPAEEKKKRESLRSVDSESGSPGDEEGDSGGGGELHDDRGVMVVYG